MWTVISVTFIVITSILGITEILRTLWLYLMRPKDSPPSVMVIFLKEDVAVQQLRYAAEYISWENRKNFLAVAAMDTGLTDETKEKIQKIVNNRSDMIFGEKAFSECVKDFKTN